ncbi:hypothetical protein Patl1_04640 [Pistacia atlantica]|uniref:Uncharacterized protein n=1 Tax=Pistacia atlantica TaxID=434234 RepID=A0ACC1BWJ5_9ROSI|nr:hypothetical protein Patl1_04640 [Pistacia atlantica]
MRSERKPSHRCFLCNGDHWLRDCSQKKALNAMFVECETSNHAQISSLQLFNSLRVCSVPLKPKGGSLMYLDARVNGKRAKVTVDTRTTHNFTRTGEAKRLGLKLEREQGRLKIVHSEAIPVDGIAHGVELHLDHWKGVVNLSTVPMDECDIVLGMEFMRQYNVVVTPCSNVVCIINRGPCINPTIAKLKSNAIHLSSMQLVGDENLGARASYTRINKLQCDIVKLT